MRSKYFKRMTALVLSMICMIVFVTSAFANDDNAANHDARTMSGSYTPNMFYSTYDNGTLYKDTATVKRLQMRSNCYGYAFRLAYCHMPMPDVGFYGPCYKQQPGEFALKSSGLNLYTLNAVVARTLYDYSDIEDFMVDAFYYDMYNLSDLFYMMQQLVYADASRMGYTVTEYTGSGVPTVTYANKRLIALVVSQNDYHFYMQHSDGTWSHKAGDGPVQNTCFGTGHAAVTLTNSNILNHMKEDQYTGGQHKLYYITKNAVPDYMHYMGHDRENPITRTQLVEDSDLAGNYQKSAVSLGVTPVAFTEAMIDYVDDVDYYYYKPRVGKTYQVVVTPKNNIPITVKLYETDGTLITTQSVTSGACTVNVGGTAGLVYILSVSSPGQTDQILSNSYTINIS